MDTEPRNPMNDPPETFKRVRPVNREKFALITVVVGALAMAGVAVWLWLAMR